MNRYKKTSLKFDKNLGYGRNLRATALNESRALLRNSRFSMQRCLETEEEVEQIPKSRIATLGKSTLKVPLTREQMLQKWKGEKEMKRQIESQNKKPTFKLCVSAPVFSSLNKADSKTFSMKNSQKVSFSTTNISKGIKETCLKPPPSIAKFQANNITNKKTPKSKESQVPATNSKPPITNSSNSKESQVPATNSKPPITNFSNSNVKKDLNTQVPNRAKVGLQKPSFIASKQFNNKHVSQATSKSAIERNKPSFIEKSRIKPVLSITKPTESKAFKKLEQVQPSLVGRIPNRVPESKIKPVSYQNSGRQLKVPSKLTVPIKSAGILNKTDLNSKQEIKTNEKEETSNTNITFSCNISHIEPVEEKSFAPKDFTFDLGADLSFSYLEGPMALYYKLKAGEERTSTPNKKEILEIQRQDAANTNGKTEEICSKIEQVSVSQVTQDAIEVPPQQNTTTCSEEKYTEAVTRLVGENSVPSIVSNESGVHRSIEDKSKVGRLVTKNNLEDQPLMANLRPEKSIISIQEGLSAIEESPNSSLATPSIEEKGSKTDEFNSKPTVPKQETSEHNEYICSTTSDNKTNFGLEHSLNQGPVKLNEEKFIFEDTKAYIKDESASVPPYEEKENVPDDVFKTNHEIPKLDNSENHTRCSGTIANNVSIPGLKNLKEKESVKLKFEKQIILEEIGAFAMPGTSSSSFNQFKVPVLEGDAGIVTKRRSASRVSNMSMRGRRISEMPQLESISESSSPCKSPPKPPKTPKSRKSTISKDFTPRRSVRLARNSVLDATENLFDVRLSLCGDSPDLPENSTACDASRITYDFDKLHLEQATGQLPTPQRRISTRTKKKVSLLYTPPQKGSVSTLRKSIKGDLMSFSPDV